MMKCKKFSPKVIILCIIIMGIVSGCKAQEPSLKDYSDFYNGIFYGRYEDVKSLLKRYPNLINWEFNVGDYQGDSLMTAALGDTSEITELLLHSGAEPNYYTDAGVTPLMVAVSHERYTIVKQLLQAGADVQMCAKDGSTVLHYLGMNGSTRIAEVLFPLIDNIDQEKDGGFTPLAVALGNYHNELAFRFIEAGADVKKALDSAPHIIPEFVMNDNREMLVYFWEQGLIDPSVMYQENNLFHYACWQNNINFVKELLARGLWDHTPNPAGDTPLDLAREFRNQEIIDLVEAAGFGE